jgi:purine-binding chemotaxis protein CheW
MAQTSDRRQVVLVRARGWLCALRAEDVIETMRPLPIEPVTGVPLFVKGLSVVRGEPVPVLALARLLGGDAASVGRRFVAVRVGARCIALEVDEVVGVEEIDAERIDAAPPLLSKALPAEVERLGVLDGQALALLDAGRLLSEDAWRSLPGAAAAMR